MSAPGAVHSMAADALQMSMLKLCMVINAHVVANQFHRGASGETSVVERVLLTSDEDSMFIYKVCRLSDITSPHSRRCL